LKLPSITASEILLSDVPIPDTVVSASVAMLLAFALSENDNIPITQTNKHKLMALKLVDMF
jgi:hypothetical protein